MTCTSCTDLLLSVSQYESGLPVNQLSAPPHVATLKAGFKLVGNNINKSIKPRYMHSDKHRNQSLHYFHSFAVKNRIYFSHLLDVYPQTAPTNTMLPSEDDDRILRKYFSILISRILVTHMPFFRFSFDKQLHGISSMTIMSRCVGSPLW